MVKKFNVGDTCWIVHGYILEWNHGRLKYDEAPNIKEAVVVKRRSQIRKNGRSSITYSVREKDQEHTHIGLRASRLLHKEEYLAIKLSSPISI